MKKINKYYIGLFLILALPILNAIPWLSNWVSPPDWGKTIVFRIILSLLIFLLVFQIVSRKELTFKTSLPLCLLIVLLGIFVLATLFSQNPGYSFFGDPHRAGGSLNFILYIVFSLLCFLLIKKWDRIWDFSLLIGVLVSLIALFQEYNILSDFIVPVEGRPFSTTGDPTLLALYLLLLVFITMSFTIKSVRNLDRKWFFYLPALLLFIYVILITGSRAAYFGLLIGFVYFFLAYPKKNKLVILSKVIILLILIAVIYGVYYVNTGAEIKTSLRENKLIKAVLPRLSIRSVLKDPRFSAWLISVEAIKERPLLGYGPENFSIAFDKYYDPLLPSITKDWGSWYDKAHSFIFDIAVTVGIPGLIVFISLFASLFWELQKLKEKQSPLIPHGIQATFLAYFSVSLFSFDTFSSYLILFLLIAYSLSLISKDEKNIKFSQGNKYKNIFISIISFCLICFIWFLNLKPLAINRQANIALRLENENCEESLNQMERVLFSNTFLDHYLGIKYANITGICIKKHPDKSLEMAQKVIEVLEKNTELRPNYTRNWLYLGIYSNFLIENGISSVDEANYYFKKAEQLSPKRQEVFLEWAKTYFITKDYLKAKEKAQKCIELNPIAPIGECWWLKGLSNIYLGDIQQAKIDLKTADQKKYNTKSKDSLLQLFQAYLETGNYEELIEIHEELIKLEPNNPQYYASLAYNYKVLGDYENAGKTAKKILELFPEMKQEVEEFLKTLN